MSATIVMEITQPGDRAEELVRPTGIQIRGEPPQCMKERLYQLHFGSGTTYSRARDLAAETLDGLGNDWPDHIVIRDPW